MIHREEPVPELPSSEERLRLALEAARMGTWEWDLLSNRQAISPEAEALLGLPPGSFTGQTEQLWSAVLPEDQSTSIWPALVKTRPSGWRRPMLAL